MTSPDQPESGGDTYPRLVGGRWIKSPLAHLALYADRAEESYAAVPVALLLTASRFRECSARRTFDYDEDGPMPPFEAICRRQEGHVHDHSNGYYTWQSEMVTPPASTPEEGGHVCRGNGGCVMPGFVGCMTTICNATERDHELIGSVCSCGDWFAQCGNDIPEQWRQHVNAAEKVRSTPASTPEEGS